MSRNTTLHLLGLEYLRKMSLSWQHYRIKVLSCMCRESCFSVGFSCTCGESVLCKRNVQGCWNLTQAARRDLASLEP